jgi:Tfp pilus assembly protein PilZ
MSTVSNIVKFNLVFNNSEELDQSLTMNGTEAGFFCETTKTLSPGERVSLEMRIRGKGNTASLEGRVQWRRVRPGGPDLPAGVFVGLIERDRIRIKSIIRYLQSDKRLERRKSVRYQIPLRASYKTSKGEFQSEVRDISKTGAFIRCHGPLLPLGAQFPLVLLAEHGEDKGVSVTAQVAWIDYLEQNLGMGVVFVGSKFQVKKIEKLLLSHKIET